MGVEKMSKWIANNKEDLVMALEGLGYKVSLEKNSLRLCPVCKSTARGWNLADGKYYVMCDGLHCGIRTQTFDSQNLAILKWNSLERQK